jgi:hypothetical protein
MSIQPDELKKKLTPEVRERILRDNWHSHDARWFLKVSQELGFDVANRLNQVTLRSHNKTDLKRILQAVEFKEIENINDAIMIFEIAADLYFPRPMLEIEIKATSTDSAAITITKCPTFEEVKKAEIIGLYECTCWIRVESWLDVCDLDGQVKIQRSMMQGDSICEISVSSISSKSK